jgi:WD40 repeat protein/tetratricopeptide (TPR) repeat protein
VPAAAAACVLVTIATAFALVTRSRNEAVALYEQKSSLADQKAQLADDNADLARANWQLAQDNGELAREKGREAEQARTQRRRAEEEAETARLRAYFLAVTLAHREWQAGNVELAEKTLDECPLAPRRWEWAFLKRLCHADLLTLEGHRGGACAAAYSPDGRRLATAGADGAAVWDADTGERLRQLRGHTGAVLAVAYDRDGRRLVTAGADGTARVWDAAGKELLHFTGHAAPVTGVAFAPSGLVASCAGKSEDKAPVLPGEVKLWDPATGREIRAFRGRAGPAWGVSFSPDGRLLASAGLRPSVCVWEVETGRLLRTFHAARGEASAVAFGPDGRHVAASAGAVIKPAVKLTTTVGRSPVGHVWDLGTGAEVFSFREAEGEGGASGVAFGPDGRHVAFASASRLVTVCEVDAGGEAAAFRGHLGWVSGVAFRPDGARLASTDTRQHVKVWDLTEGPEGRSLRDPEGHFQALNFGRDGRAVASLSRGALTLWDPATGRARRRLGAGAHSLAGVALHPGGRLAAVAGVGNAVDVWDFDSGERARSLRGHTQEVVDLAFSPDGRLLASSGNDHVVKVWDAATGAALFDLRFGPAPEYVLVLRVRFSPDGRRLALACADGVRVVELDGRREVFTRDAGPGDSPWDVSWGQGDKLLAVGRMDGRVEVWRLADGVRLWSWSRSLQGLPCRVSFSPDGSRLAGAGGAGEVIVWDTATGQEVLNLPAGASSLREVQFSPDGRWLAVLGGHRGAQLLDGGMPASGNAGRRTASPEGTAAWHRGEARSAAQARAHFAAAFHLDRLLADRPGEPALYLARGRARVELGRYAEAAADATRALEGNPDGVDALAVRGVARARMGKAEEAVADLSAALDRNPAQPSLRAYRGMAYAALGRWEEAARDYGAAAPSLPDNFELWCDYALVCLKCGHDDEHRRVCRALVGGLGGRPNAEAAVRLAWLAALAPDAVPGPALLELAGRANAMHRDPYQRGRAYGAALFRAGKFEEAVRQLDAAQALRPQPSPSVWLLLAMTEHRLGHADKAKQWQIKARDWIASARGKKTPAAGPDRLTWDGLPWNERLALERLEAEAGELLGRGKDGK